MHNVILAAATLMISSVAAAPVVAQQAPAEQQNAKPALDPNQVICEKQEETGSRLSSKRVCMTRSQWAEQRRLDRMEIDRVQIQRNCGNSDGAGQC